MKIAFLGLGQMGRRMVAHLIEAGHDIAVWNRSQSATSAFEGRARIAATPAEAVADAEAVLTMLTDDAASRAVWNEILPAAKAGTLTVEMSTVSIERISELAGQAADKGLNFIDAPVAGSLPQAEAGQLIFLVGGDDVKRFAPLADLMGGRLLHAGETGKGMALKLMVNTLLGVQTIAMAELVRFGETVGIERGQTAELLGDLPVTSPAAKGALGLIVQNKHDPMFPIDLIAKDLDYFLKAYSADLTHTTHQTFVSAQKKGLGDRHITAVAMA